MINGRPPAPRYQDVWDVDLVVRHIEDGQPTADLSLKELSKRTITLLALRNASKALDIRFKQPVGEDVTWMIS